MKWYEKLKFARCVTGMTIRQVSDKTGISNAYVCEIESGKINDPSFFKISLLLKLYNLTSKDLLD